MKSTGSRFHFNKKFQNLMKNRLPKLKSVNKKKNGRRHFGKNTMFVEVIRFFCFWSFEPDH